MDRERSVIHLNVADFAVAVERLGDRSLVGRPVIIAPLHAVRAFVYDMSNEAYEDGVRKGMPLTQAVRYCRGAQVLAPRPDRYRRVMAALVSQTRQFAPRLEHGSEDGHLFLDLTGTHRLFGAAADVGLRLRRQLRNDYGLDPIWSLAGSKLVAKVASRLVKPVGAYIVGNGEEEQFLAPLPVQVLPGLSGRERLLLREFNISRVGQLAELGASRLQTVFGERGDWLLRLSRGIDDAPVQPEGSGPSSIEVEHLFPGDVAGYDVVAGAVSELAVRLGIGVRQRYLAVRRLQLALVYTDGSRVVRQVSVSPGVADDFALRRLAGTALLRAWGRRVRVRGCRLRGERLHRQSSQLQLFSGTTDGHERHERLTRALDGLRSRFGDRIVRFGNQSLAD